MKMPRDIKDSYIELCKNQIKIKSDIESSRRMLVIRYLLMIGLFVGLGYYFMDTTQVLGYLFYGLSIANLILFGKFLAKYRNLFLDHEKNNEGLKEMGKRIYGNDYGEFKE